MQEPLNHISLISEQNLPSNSISIASVASKSFLWVSLKASISFKSRANNWLAKVTSKFLTFFVILILIVVLIVAHVVLHIIEQFDGNVLILVITIVPLDVYK